MGGRYILLVLLLSTFVALNASKLQCTLPKTYDFEGALRRSIAAAAAERALQGHLFLENKATMEEEITNKQEMKEQELKEQEAAARRAAVEEEQAKRKQEEADARLEQLRLKHQEEKEARRKQQQEELKRKQQEELKRKQQEEMKRKQQEEMKRKQQQQQQQQQRHHRRQQQQPNKPEKPCPYTVLGVGRDASQAEIKSAYRKLARKYHPDKVSDEEKESAEQQFTLLVDAYEILGDEDRRVMHDEESFGQYQSRPHNFNSKAGFYTGNSFVKALNHTEFDRLVMCKGPFAEGEACEPFMIHFYTPWCVHCKNMIAEWKRAASQMDGTETPLGYVNFAGVNCETNKNLCRVRGISSYPEIHLYARDAKEHEHMEKFHPRKPRSVDNFIDFCEKGIRLAHESTLEPIDAFIMDKNVTNSESKGLWVVMFEGRNCPKCAPLKAALRRMSANIRDLANFGVFDCDKQPKICQQQYVGKQYPVLKLYPYTGAKGTGETLVDAGTDPLVVLPIVEKVIRMCLANIEAENSLMKTLHEEDEEYEEPEPPKQQYQYPEPERQTHRVLPAGVRANGGRQYIAG